jgi:hypothetical protein
MNKEIFKDIPGYEGIYQVSNLGNVKSLAREILLRGKYPFISKEKILKPCNNKIGYYTVSLNKYGKKKYMAIHVLVAMAFLGHVPSGHNVEVDHKNDIKTDNKVENLQLLSGDEHRRKPKKSMNTSSEYTGVSWYKPNNKWKANLFIYGKHKHLGYFTDELEAHEAYKKALEMYNNGDLSFMQSKKSSQYKGVNWDKSQNKWLSRIYINGKSKHLGYFTDEHQAHLAYQKALENLYN